MSLDFSDPRLTAYALDELDAAERAEVEAELAGDPERPGSSRRSAPPRGS